MPVPGRHPRGIALLLLGALAALGAACADDGGAAGAASGADGAVAEIEAVGEPDEGIDGVTSFRVESNDHTESAVEYAVVPPPGGPHHPVWARCGFYDEAVADEHVVHDLEHGAVWLAYSPELSAADVEVVHDLARANDKVIATPYDELPPGAAVVASAWARQLAVDAVDDPRLEHFVIQYQDGSQAPEAGATCADSPVGSPIP